MKNTLKHQAIGRIAGIIVLVTVIIFSMAACGDDSTPDTWTDVTSLSQIDGSWKTSHTDSFENNGIKMTISYSNFVVTFNAAAKTMSMSGTATVTYSGGNINELWPSLKESLINNQGNGVTYTNFNDANHSYTMTANNASQSMTDADLAGYQINQNGTKLRSLSQDGSEVIFTKQ
jgi:hypothetical protein